MNLRQAAIKGTKQGGMQTEDAERPMPHVKRLLSAFYRSPHATLESPPGACFLLCVLPHTGTREPRTRVLRWAPRPRAITLMSDDTLTLSHSESPRPCPTHASLVFKLRRRPGHLSSHPPISFLFSLLFPEPRLSRASPPACFSRTSRLLFSPTGRSGTLKQPPPLFPRTLMDLHSQPRIPTSLGFYHSRREASVSPTNSSAWSMPVTPIDSPTAYRAHAYDPYPSSLSDARHLPYPAIPAHYAYYPKPHVTLPPFSTLLPKEDRPPQLFQRPPTHHIRPFTPDTPIFDQRDFTGSTSSSAPRRPPSLLSSDLPFAKRRRADPESDQYLARLEGNKARCTFLLEHDPDAGGEVGVCAYEARSDMVRRHIRAVHLKLK